MLALRNINKAYQGPLGRVEVLRDFELTLKPGDLAVIQGASGCGKSTLLFTAGAMLPPDRGSVMLMEDSIYAMSRARRCRLRAEAVGFIFQRFHLIPYLTVAQNILWPLRWRALGTEAGQRLAAVSDRLGIRHRFEHRPDQLSAGELQRVAVARALMGDKKLICADEPTGNLDEANAAIVIDVLREEAERGCMVLLVTHQRELASLGNVYLDLGTDR